MRDYYNEKSTMWSWIVGAARRLYARVFTPSCGGTSLPRSPFGLGGTFVESLTPGPELETGSVVPEVVVDSASEAVAAFVRSKAPDAVAIGLEPDKHRCD